MFDSIISIDKWLSYIELGYVVDARNGGLILGPSHEEGGIMMYGFDPSLKSFMVKGEMEGYEYIFNPDASNNMPDVMHKINISADAGKRHLFEPYQIPMEVKTIDVRYHPSVILWICISRQFIVNRNSTRLLLTTIDKINRETFVFFQEMGILVNK